MISTYHFAIWVSQVAQMIKNSPLNAGDPGSILGSEDPTDGSNPTSVFLLESYGQRSSVDPVHGVAKVKMWLVTKCMRVWTSTHTKIVYYSKIICAPTIYSFCSITLDNFWSFYFVILLLHNVRYLELYSIQPWEAERLVICISSSSMSFLALWHFFQQL